MIAPRQRSGGHRFWLMRALALAVTLAAVILLYRTVSQFSPREIYSWVRQIPPRHLLLAGIYAAGSYLSLTLFDWLGLRYAGKPLAYRRAALASFCSLSISHSIGVAALSSAPLRYRFYSRWGLNAGDVAKVVLFSGTTVALGLMTLGGLALLLHADLGALLTGLTLPAARAAGIVCLALSAGYVALAAAWRQPIAIRRWPLRMPEPKIAAAQILVGSVNYVFVSACLHQTMSGIVEVPYVSVAAVFVLANSLALILHVPGGVGVIEGVVTFLLPAGGVIGAVLMFRFIYFLIPLAIGTVVFAGAEWRFRHQRRRT